MWIPLVSLPGCPPRFGVVFPVKFLPKLRLGEKSVALHLKALM